MWEITYSKYSNQRGIPYKIRTQILEDELGNKKIEKVALVAEAQQHINSIKNSSEKLKEIYQDDELYIPKCELKGDIAELEYVEGITLSEIIEDYYDRHEHKQVKNLLKEYDKRISSNNSIPFTITSDFEKVFGKVSFEEELQAIPIGDIDIIFDNIIVQADKWNIIDYEWTFEFPIPVKFIIYRALFFYAATSKKRSQIIKELKLYSCMGISPELKAKFEIMEQNFERYINGDTITLHQLHQQINPNKYSEIVEQKENYIVEQRAIIEQKENYIIEQRGIIEQKENYIVEQRSKIEELERRLNEIEQSKYYKVYKKVKNTLRGEK